MYFDLIGPSWTAVLLIVGVLVGAIAGYRLFHSECPCRDDDYWVAMVFVVVIGAIMGFLLMYVLPVIILAMVFFAILYLVGRALKKIFG